LIHQLHIKEQVEFLEPGEVARISRWATESLFPTLTIIIDLPPSIGLGRLKSKDRLEGNH
jgi:dTMP kinase